MFNKFFFEFNVAKIALNFQRKRAIFAFVLIQKFRLAEFAPHSMRGSAFYAAAWRGVGRKSGGVGGEDLEEISKTMPKGLPTPF